MAQSVMCGMRSVASESGNMGNSVEYEREKEHNYLPVKLYPISGSGSPSPLVELTTTVKGRDVKSSRVSIRLAAATAVIVV
jgi:hypothetical protein